MYVARFTQTPSQDVERNWSGYFAPFYTDTKEALEFFGFLPEGYDYIDDDERAEIDLDEIAERNNLVRDPHTQAWRPFHHNGLSCWLLNASTLEDAIVEAKAKHGTQEISWGGFGNYTKDSVSYICTVEGDLCIFQCNEVGWEE